MGIFDFLFGKPLEGREHPFFGQMLFVESSQNPENNYFECRRHFKPIDENIEIGLSGDMDSSLENQQKFFQEIENNYDEIKRKIIPLIENEVQKWNPTFNIKDFDKEFKPVYLRIPRCDKDEKFWEIAFNAEHDLNHSYSISMKNFEPVDILIDG